MLHHGGKMVVQTTGTVLTHAEAVQRLMQMLEQSSKREGRDPSSTQSGIEWCMVASYFESRS